MGKDLAEQAKAFAGPVKDLFNQVSIDLLSEMPNAAGLSPKNIEYCKRFYELYAGLAENQQVVDFLLAWNPTITQCTYAFVCAPLSHLIRILTSVTITFL